MVEHPPFHIPLLQGNTLTYHNTASPSVIDTTLASARTLWPHITHKEIEEALDNDFANGDTSKAITLLQFYFDAVDGHVTSMRGERRNPSAGSLLAKSFNKGFSSKVKAYPQMRGTQNFGGVSCYIDSLLVAMFSRMENFEPLLYQKFDDEKINTLAIWLRLFVNLLRNGEMLTRDLMRGLLAACVDAGWTDPATGLTGPATMQQDASEFFNFITERLHMPLLSLRVDIAHAGKEDENDDHKTVQEQLLYLPVPGTENDGPILLEECLELYFANNISVNRHVERNASIQWNTGQSSPGTANQSPEIPNGGFQRHRSYSIVSQKTSLLNHRRYLQDTESTAGNESPVSSTFDTPNGASVNASTNSTPNPTPAPTNATHHRRQSSGFNSFEPPSYRDLFGETTGDFQETKRKLWTSNNEITFPAWMFLQLMPFYGEARESDGSLQNIEAQQVAQHFSRARPVLGLCLKRYYIDENGISHRNNRKVIVPETIFLPSFVADDSDSEHAFGNFKLELQSVVFHSGHNLNSGHYTSLISEDTTTPLKTSTLQPPTERKLWRLRSKKEKHHHLHLHQNLHENSTPPSTIASTSADDLSEPPEKIYRKWLLFDDLAPEGEKLQEVDFATAMEQHSPYLVFYRMVQLEKRPCPSFEDSVDSTTKLSPGPSPQLMPTFAPGPDFDTHQEIDNPKSNKLLGRSRLFRKRDKDYASQYREEKCILM